MNQNAPVLLLTRPREASERFAQLVPELAAILSPLLQIMPLAPALPTGPLPLVFTSANGVWAFGRLRAAQGQLAYCVGPRTAQAAKGAGYDVMSAEGAVDDLVALILSRATDGPLLYACGRIRTGDLDGKLRRAGLQVTTCEVYDQVPQDLNAAARQVLGQAAPVILPLFSPRSAALMSAAAAGATAPLHPVFLSQNVAAAWTGPAVAGQIIAHAPNAQAMVAAVKQLMAPLSSG